MPGGFYWLRTSQIIIQHMQPSGAARVNSSQYSTQLPWKRYTFPLISAVVLIAPGNPQPLQGPSSHWLNLSQPQWVQKTSSLPLYFLPLTHVSGQKRAYLWWKGSWLWMTGLSYWVEGNNPKGIVIGQDGDGCLVWWSQRHTIRGALESREGSND